MDKSIKYSFFILLLFMHAVNSPAQTVGTNSAVQQKLLKWQGVAGKDNEFIAYLPDGFQTIADADFVTGKDRATVDKKIVASRYINGVVLIIEYYEGDAERIRANLIEREKPPADKNEVINEFEFMQFSGSLQTYFTKKQLFKYKNRLYVVKALAKSPDSKILKDFFNSITLVRDKNVVFPNLAKDVKTVSLADVAELQLPIADDAAVIDAKDTDRRPVILYTQRPKFPRGNTRPANGRIKLRLLLSASGQVSDVVVVEVSDKSLAAAAIDAGKKTKFIPAEKDGKPVSVYQMQEYTFARY